MYMPVASGTAASRGGTNDRRPPHVLPTGCADGSSFDGRWLFGGRGGTFADVVASAAAAALCFHIHRLPPLAGSRVRIGPVRPRCEYRRALSSADSDSVQISPLRHCEHPRSRLPTPNARGRAASRFSLPLRSVAFRRACASVIWLVLSP